MTALREPYRADHEASLAARMERGKPPATLGALLAWFTGLLADEVPMALHRHDLWRDRVSLAELEAGVKAQGGSVLGSPDWAGMFRAYISGSPSMVDEDGYYVFPLRAALSRMSRRDSDRSVRLCQLALASGDHEALALRLGVPLDIMEGYLRDALPRLWRGTYEQTVRTVYSVG